MKVTKALRDQLVNSAYIEWQDAKKVEREAHENYVWATSLHVGSNLTAPTSNAGTGVKAATSFPARDARGRFTPATPFGNSTLYFVPSRSGTSDGHYIEYNRSTGAVNCACPGFINRSYCHASTSVKADYTAHNKNMWLFSRKEWERRRDASYQKYSNA